MCNLPHRKGQAEEEHICAEHIQQLGTKACFCTVHALTGSGISGKFAGRTKDSCFKAFLSCDDEILDALAMLGSGNDLPTDACFQLERFVCILYRSKIYTKVNELRWFLYSNRLAEGENSRQLLVRWTYTFDGRTTYP